MPRLSSLTATMCESEFVRGRKNESEFVRV